MPLGNICRENHMAKQNPTYTLLPPITAVKYAELYHPAVRGAQFAVGGWRTHLPPH